MAIQGTERLVVHGVAAIAVLLGGSGFGTSIVALRNTDDRFRGEEAQAIEEQADKTETELDLHIKDHPDRRLLERIHRVDSDHKELIFNLERRIYLLERTVEALKRGEPVLARPIPPQKHLEIP